jgi:hypothetical protein
MLSKRQPITHSNSPPSLFVLDAGKNFHLPKNDAMVVADRLLPSNPPRGNGTPVQENTRRFLAQSWSGHRLTSTTKGHAGYRWESRADGHKQREKPFLHKGKQPRDEKHFASSYVALGDWGRGEVTPTTAVRLLEPIYPNCALKTNFFIA